MINFVPPEPLILTSPPKGHLLFFAEGGRWLTRVELLRRRGTRHRRTMQEEKKKKTEHCWMPPDIHSREGGSHSLLGQETMR